MRTGAPASARTNPRHGLWRSPSPRLMTAHASYVRRSSRWPPLARRSVRKGRSVFPQQGSEYRTVAARLIGTVQGASSRPGIASRGSPRRLVRSAERLLDQALRRRQIRKPDVVEVTGRVFGLGHAAWRAAHGPQAQSLAVCSRATQSYYTLAIRVSCFREAPGSTGFRGVDSPVRWPRVPPYSSRPVWKTRSHLPPTFV